jgi:signal transduction histidine kinase
MRARGLGRNLLTAGGRRGLTRRTVIASGLLALLIGLAFAALLWAIGGMRQTADAARHSQAKIIEADGLQKLLIDLETGQRGYIITGQARLLEPWNKARAAYPSQSEAFVRFSDSPEQRRLAIQIEHAGAAYIRDYSVPLVDAAKRGDPYARSAEATVEGKRRIDTLRRQFAQYVTVERGITTQRQDAADANLQRALRGTTAGLAGSVLLIVVFAAYLTRAIVRPVRGAAAVASRLAGGDLSARMPESGADEIGELEVAFNTMGNSLEESRDELRRVAREQAALRRVATLVARGVSPSEVFSAVAGEMGHILNAPYTTIGRYEPDDTMTVVGSWSGHSGSAMPIASRWPPEDDSIQAQVARTEQPARLAHRDRTEGEIAAWTHQRGITSSVGCPVVVEGGLWGVAIAFSVSSEQPPEDTQERMRDFTGLVATAIANAESRAELTASRARVVAAADETRRRIERDLHDGTQQRLVSLGLELRAAEAAAPPELNELREQLSRTARGLAGAVEDLQELSRGLHPAILSRGGLGPALRMLARRSAIPVELDIGITGRMAQRIEIAAYYIASEALTNATKHAHASVVHVVVAQQDPVLRLAIRDDGVGGADPGQGSGLIGLRDRVEVLGGRIDIVSPVGGGTSLLVSIPVEDG